MNLESEIKTRSPKEVINDNDLFLAWIYENLTLDDVIARCPDVLSDIFEEFNNDWIEEVQNESAELGLTVDDDGDIITDESDAAYEAGYQDGASGEPSNSNAFPNYEDEYSEGYNDGATESAEE